ncbi:hypothetical protein HOY80DRAFT_1030101 [Tuber brumale]|nr:hypothetical protein HOY80DRAFT_1030101 [Tuber brumale]
MAKAKWTEAMVETLLSTLYEHIVSREKAENGFKKRAWTAAKERLKAAHAIDLEASQLKTKWSNALASTTSSHSESYRYVQAALETSIVARKGSGKRYLRQEETDESGWYNCLSADGINVELTGFVPYRKWEPEKQSLEAITEVVEETFDYIAITEVSEMFGGSQTKDSPSELKKVAVQRSILKTLSGEVCLF